MEKMALEALEKNVSRNILLLRDLGFRYHLFSDGCIYMCSYMEEKEWHVMALLKSGLECTGSWTAGDTIRAGLELIRFREESVRAIGL